MNRVLRRSFIGTLAGGFASCLLAATLGQPVWRALLGIAIGIGYAAALDPTRGAYVDNLMAGGALGVPLWGLISVIAIPLFSTRMPEWTADQMRTHFPALVGWVVYGATLGLLTQGLSDLAEKIWGPEVRPPLAVPEKKTHVVILGGGFAGMRTAECLEKQSRASASLLITLVSETNALLFTPMLAEVAGSSLEPSHISTPLRSSLHQTEFVRGRVAEVDLAGRRVILESGAATADAAGLRQDISYDHLVFALGAVSNYLGMVNLEKYSFNFKSLLDAIRIRNHVIEMFERADREADASRRRELLTFVIAGGGFAGVELAGALNDYARGIVVDYPKLRREELRIVLVHSRDRILPELSETLAQYAQKKMEERGVTFRLNTRLTDAQPGVVTLSDGAIRAETLVWTAGTAPNPVTKSLQLAKDKRGALIVDRSLQVQEHPGLWAVGDCSAVVDAKTGKPCPPTAQFALREAEVLAKNIRAHVEGRPLQEFHFDSLGALCVVGHQTACAELTLPLARGRSMRFSGLLAWLMWRGIYLAKLPGLERKIRVLMDWTVELFFPRDIVQTIDLK
jgi:NADH:ubiquinone reductase (H+-translocating)